MTPEQLALVLVLFARALVSWGIPDEPMPPSVGEWRNPGFSLATAGRAGGGECVILVGPAFWTIAADVVAMPLEEAQARVIEHEVGHCLGFGHPAAPEPSVMHEWRLGVTNLDRTRLRLRRSPHALRLTMVAAP